MKKTITAITATLLLVLLVSLGVNYLLPMFKDLFSKRTYSQTFCLTDDITENMSIYDLAKHYRDGQATVAVVCEGYNKTLKKDYESLGSGVCVASNGYTTESGYVASKGSYIATNYHVIDFFDSSEFSNCTVKILTEEEDYYSASLLWYNKDTDVALLYCDEVNINYVKMKDRVVDCEKKDRLDYEEIFTIGTPLEIDYLNRLTIGNVASNNPMVMATTEYIYPVGTSFTHYQSSKSILKYTVLSNLYEDVIDVALGITSGNSGGGCFDSKGYLVGLSTLGSDVEDTGGNQMNGVVPIYPIIKVLDRLIENNEKSAGHKIFDFENLKIKGVDALEASYISSQKTKTGYSNYYLDETLYSSAYAKAFNFEEDGYYILSNSGNINIPANSVITAMQIGDSNKITIYDRNDLVYGLLKVKSGDKVKFSFTKSSGVNSSVTVTF